MLTNMSRYLICLTIGPAFLSAGIYLCLGRMVVACGEHLSRLKPRTYTMIFVSSDLLALIFQAAGGAMASIADAGDHDATWRGIYIMIVGLSFQVLSLVIFMVLAGYFALGVRRASGSRNPRFINVTSSRKFKGLAYGKSLPESV